MAVKTAGSQWCAWRNVLRRTVEAVAYHTAMSAYGLTDQQGIEPCVVASRAVTQVAQRIDKQPAH
ncbi:MAG TPA: hypothetical protein VKV19_03010 [Ktedonobacteraceae bacterium]|nr:hypothetical protein [Ktedonobacteraceae bacterium]